MTAYLRGRSAPVPTTEAGMLPRCGGRRCGRLMAPGEGLTLVTHEQRWWRNPAAPDAHAYLCDDCCARLGPTLRDPEPSPPPPPTALRARPVEPW